MDAKFCPQCGNPRSGNFCGKCGYSFLANQGTGNSHSETSQVNESDSETMKLPKGLVRGEGFEAKKHCGNCGLKLTKDSQCIECGE